MADASFYTTGGTVQAGGGLYLTRKADNELLALCRAGSFAFVLTARQMGKSSLMTRTAERLIEGGCRTALIDLNALGTGLSAEQWYLGLLVEIQRQLDLRTRVTDWWRQRTHLGITHRMSMFFEDVLLVEVKERLILFVDEIDSTLSLDFADDFFASIRSLHNARAQRPELGRLSFVLLGVATPGDLIKDVTRTPFNLGHRVELTDFTFEEARPLIAGLGLPEEQGSKLLRWVMEWTGGHPYLTQRLCREIVQGGEGVERAVARIFLGGKSFEDNNLQFVRDMLIRKERSPNVGDVLRTFRQIRQGRLVRDDEQSQIMSHLKLSGVVRREGNVLALRNRIYEEVFTDNWAREHLPVGWKRLARRAAPPLVAVAFALLSAFLWERVSSVERDRQQVRADVELTRADRLSSESRSEYTRAPIALPRSVLLAAESMRRRATPRGWGQLASTAVLLRQPLARLAHQGPVKAVAFSPDGGAIVTAGDDKVIRIWDTATWKLMVRLAYEGSVNGLAFGPGGKTIATASDDGNAIIWDVRGGHQLVRLPHKGPVNGVTFSPDGRAVATASDDGNAIIWDVRDGQQLVRLAYKGPVNGVTFSPDGKTIATARDDVPVRVWGARLWGLQTPWHVTPVNAVTFSPDGNAIATAGQDRGVAVWDTASGKSLARLAHEGMVNAVAFSPDGNAIATAGQDGVVQVWDAASRKLLARLAHEGPVNAVVFSPDGKTIATAGQDGAVRAWEATNRKSLAHLAHEGSITALAFRPDGKVLATASDDRTARLWDVESGKLLARLVHADVVNALAFSPDRKVIATVSKDKTARVWDAETGKSLARLPHEDWVNAVAFSPDGKAMATASDDRAARVWDAASGKLLASFFHEGSVNAVVFSPDGKTIATASKDKTAQVWEVASGKPLARLIHKDVVNAVAFSPDGKAIATASGDGAAQLWSAAAGPVAVDGGVVANEKPLMRLAHEGPVSAVVFSPDGKAIATAGRDGAALVWDATNGRLLVRLVHEGPVNAVAFSPDGKAIVTAGLDKTTRIWEVTSGKLLASLAHEGPVNAVAFGLNGKVIAAAGRDGVAFIAPWRPEDLLDATCSLLNRNMTRGEWAIYLGADEPYRKTCPNLPEGASVTGSKTAAP